MKMFKTRRTVVTAIVVLAIYIVQCTVFPALAIANIKPNLMLIATASFGFMRGPREGMIVGFASGLLIDIQHGNMIGFYALIYLLAGYINGMFEQMYFDEDIKLPLFLIAGSDFIYGVAVYFLMFLLRSDVNLSEPDHHSGGNLYNCDHIGFISTALIYQPQIGSRREKECK